MCINKVIIPATFAGFIIGVHFIDKGWTPGKGDACPEGGSVTFNRESIFITLN